MCGKVFFLECFFCVSGEIPWTCPLWLYGKKALADTVLRMQERRCGTFPVLVGAEGKPEREAKKRKGARKWKNKEEGGLAHFSLWRCLPSVCLQTRVLWRKLPQATQSRQSGSRTCRRMAFWNWRMKPMTLIRRLWRKKILRKSQRVLFTGK